MSNMSLTLNKDEYRRYGRQMQVTEFGSLNSQLLLKNSKILVIGAGGLGSSALLYLSSAGIGTIGIIDYDIVDITNLHRQIIHDSTSVNTFKTESAKKRINLLNPNVKVNLYTEPISNSNSFRILKDYDLILDCTDKPMTRYLINDSCVLLNKPLVSGSALKTEGQLTILNYLNGPCYRCFFPTPPKPETIGSCSDDGVIGSNVGLIGVLMATESIKILTKYYENGDENSFKPYLAMYQSYSPQQSLRTFKMRSKSKNCIICNGTFTRKDFENFDYDIWCGKLNYNVLKNSERVSYIELNSWLNDDNNLLIDVRPSEQFNIDHIKNSINLPLKKLQKMTNDELDEFIKEPVLVVCRFGNDSQLAARRLIDSGYDAKDVIGGIQNWVNKTENNSFNVYW